MAALPATMSAAVYHGAGDVRLEQVPVPVRRPGHALLRIVRSGMCGTDASEWKSGPRIFPVSTPHRVTGHHGPIILGHEFIGEVLEIDEGAGFAVGDTVASGAGVWCGECDRCREGRTNLCASYYTLGLSIDGGMAEYVSCPVETLESVPAGMDPDVAGLAQPLAVGLHAARRARVEPGDRVVLIGAGAIGTFVLAGLRSLVEADITVVDFPGKRLDRALRIGANRIVPTGDGAAEAIADAVGPLGADVVIEASGAPGQLDAALAFVRDGGRVLQVGLPSGEQGVNVHAFVMREISIETTLAHVCGEDLAPALQILETSGLAAELFDSVHPLGDLPGLLDDLSHGLIDGKVLVDPALPSEVSA